MKAMNAMDVVALSLGPHCAYFRVRKLKPQVAKALSIKCNLLEC